MRTDTDDDQERARQVKASSRDQARIVDRALNRRRFLKGLGLAGGVALAGGVRSLSPLLPEGLDPGDDGAVLRTFYTSLTPAQRELILLPWEHPSRQLTNTVAILERPHLGTILDSRQRALATRLYSAMLSERGHADLSATLALEAGGLDGCVLVVYGDPLQGPAQPLITGGHLTLRGGGASSQPSAFGGPIAYGQQRGNNEFKVAGNAFAFQGDAANALYGRLDVQQKARSRRPAPPNELVLQAQGARGRFEGIAGRDLTAEQRPYLEGVLAAVFAGHPERERAEAWACIEANGGVEALHVAYYESKGFFSDGTTYAGRPARDRKYLVAPYFQVWRIEGPGCVIHFKGHPHVHAYVNIVRDPAAQNIGEEIARTKTLFEGENLASLIEGGLRAATGESHAYVGSDPPGRICPGAVTTGLVWTLDPYGNRVGVARIRGEAATDALRAHLAARGLQIREGETYRVATHEYAARDVEGFGQVESFEPAETRVRDALVDQIRRSGLPRAASA